MEWYMSNPPNTEVLYSKFLQNAALHRPTGEINLGLIVFQLL